ncbi:MAG: DoxX family protein [Acidobacteria bacterium]|nr:DoxX family protein [Acidobacteriota bacterium]
MSDIFLLGRILLGGFFTFYGVNHFLNLSAMAQYAAAKGVPSPETAVLASGTLLVIGGLSVLLGLWPHIGAACLGLFLIGVTPIMHDFWDIADPVQRMNEMAHFTKNLALLGGVLMMVGVPRPWPYSLERRQRIIA